MRTLLSGAALLLLVFAMSCGASSRGLTETPPTPTVEVPATQLAGLPALPPATHFTPQRATSAAVVRQFGAQATSAMNHSMVGNDILFNPPAKQPAYGLYQFNGAPGEVVSGIEYETTGLDAGEDVWVGIGDYSTGRWTFFTPQTAATGTINVSNAPGQFVSAGGDIYVLVVAFDTDSFTLNRIGLGYDDRWVVSGTVVDQSGAGVPDAVVSTPFASINVTTDASGNFVLPGLPDGSWPLVVTKSGWTFYSNPATVTVAGADMPGQSFTGFENGANLLPADPDPGNDSLRQPEPLDLSAPYAGTLSAIDDSTDCFRLNISTPGTYHLKFSNPNHAIFFPAIMVNTPSGSMVDNSYAALHGTIAVPLTAATAGTEYVIQINCSGGGGAYSLTLASGGVEQMEGLVDELGGGLDNALVRAVNDVTGEDTIYTTTIGFGAGTFMDYYRPAVSTTVTASLPEFTFAPLQHVANLAAGPDMAVNFTGTENARADSFEPNNSVVMADANAALSLPFDSTTVPNPLLLGSGDSQDYYRVSPANAQGLRIRLTSDYPREGLPFFVDIFEQDGVTGVPIRTFYGQGTVEVRLAGLTDGGNYYVMLSPYFGVTHDYSYEMQIESFTPYELQSLVEFDGVPVPGENVKFYLDNFTIATTLATDAAGLTPPLQLADGEIADVELFRYGFDTDRHTVRAVISGANLEIPFSATDGLSLDSLEPNDDFFSPVPVTVPGTISASLSIMEDFQDCYKMSFTTEDALRVAITSGGTVPYLVELYDSVFNLMASNEVVPGGPARIFPISSGAGDYSLVIYASGSDSTYEADISTLDAFSITGTVTAAGVGVPNANVYCTELNRYVFSDPVTGAYDLGVFEPGTYTVVTRAPGYTVNEGAQTVTITNADEVTNFTLTTNIVDADEPNDTSVLAAPCTTDGSVSSLRSIGLAGDLADYYKFTGTAGDQLEVIIDWQDFWTPNLFVSVYDSLGNYVTGEFPINASQARAIATLPANDTYYIEVIGGPNEYTYQVTLN